MKHLLAAVFAVSLLLAGCLGIGEAPNNFVEVTPNPNIEVVQFTTPDNWTLTGFYFKPIGPINKSVVLLHQLGADKSSWGDLPATFQYSGIGVLVVDQRGHGDSFINGRKKSYSTFGPDDFQKMVDDGEAFATFFKERRPNDEIYFVGASIGANVALNYAARDKNLSGVVMLSPGIDYRGIATTGTISQYGSRPLLLIASKGDEYSTLSAKQLSEKSPSTRTTLQVVEGSAHGTNLLNANPELKRTLGQWIVRN
jgi:dienelactone hydrolase